MGAALGAKFSGGKRRWARLLAAFLVTTAVSTVAGIAPASAAPAASITTTLDATQGTGFTAPSHFETGALVRYRITFQCSSLTEPCGTGTITDLLDPNLDFVQVVPASSTVVGIAGSFDPSSHVVTIALTNFQDGTTGEAIVVAKVKSSAPGGPIPDEATITVPDGPTNTSAPVVIDVPAPTPQWSIDKTRVTPAGNPAPDAPVRYDISLSSDAMLGNVGVTSAAVVDRFPPGAIVVDSASGVVDDANHTITWTVGALDPAVGSKVWDRLVTLQFPTTPRAPGDPTFAAGDTVTNTADAHLAYTDGTSGGLDHDSTFVLDSPSPALATGKSGVATVITGTLMTWYVSGHDQGNTVVTDPELVDGPLPTGVSGLYLAFPDSSFVPASPQIFEQEVGGTWEPLAEWTTASTTANFGQHPLDPAATAVRARPTSGQVDPGVDFGTIRLWATVTGSPGSSFQNCAQSDAGALTSNVACVTTTVAPQAAVVDIAKGHNFTDSSAAGVVPGTTFDYAFDLQADTDLGHVRTFTVSDTLPAGFTYEGLGCVGTWGLGGGNGTVLHTPCSTVNSLANGSDFPAPVVTPNVDGHGATRLSWHVDLTSGHFGITEIPKYSALVFHLDIRVDDGTAVGSFTNHVTLVTDLPTTCFGWSAASGAPDADDLDSDGDTTENTCSYADSVQVDAAAIVDASKWDDGAAGLPHVLESTGQPDPSCPDDGAGYTRYPCVAQTTPNGPVSYRIHLRNIGNVNATDDVTYDVLPYVGDTGVSQVLAGQARTTDWTPVMTGPVTVLDEPADAGTTVEYNLTTNPCRPELNQGAADGAWQSTCDDTWYTASQVTDWASVRSFRVRAFQPVAGVAPAWAPLASIDLQVDLRAPQGAPTSTSSPLDLSIAWNSIAHRDLRLNGDGTTTRLLAAEPRKVGVIIPFTLPDSDAVGDVVWYDTNHDGVQDAGEPRVPGVTVTLRNSDGSPAVDVNGNEVPTTVTDAQGHYVFDDLAAGEYEVEFTNLPAGYETTAQAHAGDQSTTDDSNVPAGRTSSATTPPFTIGDAQPGMDAPAAGDGVTHARAINRTIDAGIWQSPEVSATTTTVPATTTATTTTTTPPTATAVPATTTTVDRPLDADASRTPATPTGRSTPSASSGSAHPSDSSRSSSELAFTGEDVGALLAGVALALGLGFTALAASRRRPRSGS